jgi:hypothetical protein
MSQLRIKYLVIEVRLFNEFCCWWRCVGNEVRLVSGLREFSGSKYKERSVNPGLNCGG